MSSNLPVHRPRLSLVLLACGSVLLTLLVFEVILRLVTPGVKLFDTRNFTFEPLSIVNIFPMVLYDPNLGYAHKPNYRPAPLVNGRGAFGPLGNRLSQPIDPDGPPPPVPQHNILAIGDSFTFGSEVEPEQSWPADLERLLGVPVVNAGIGGYGLDQSLISAEKKIPVVQPRVLIVSLIIDMIERTEFSVFSGANKPYFDLDGGKLILRNTPAPPYVPSYQQIGWKRRILGYSYLLMWTFDRIGLGDRWRQFPFESRTVHNNGNAVSCALMGRLQDDVRAAGINAIVVGQYALSHLTDETRSARLRGTLECARQAGLPVLDFWDSLQALRQSDPERIKTFYEAGGHMSERGNAFTADALAAFLRKTFPEAIAALRAN